MQKIFSYILSLTIFFFCLSCDEKEDEVKIVEPIIQDGIRDSIESSYDSLPDSVLDSMLGSAPDSVKVPADSAAQYEMYFPPLDEDEWDTLGVRTLGWDEALFQEAIDYVRERDSYSFMVLYKGRIVAEHYWRGSNVSTVHPVESISKSVAAFLIGILQQEYDFDINGKVSAYLGDGWSNAAVAKEGEITVKHLLTMTSGLDEELEYAAPPGEKWFYNNRAYDVLITLCEEVSGLSRDAFSQKYLFSKIGMDNASWNNTMLQSNARDMARFGLMILEEAKWSGQEILQDKNYFAAMLNTSQPLQEAYGYLWWLNGKQSYLEGEVTSSGPICPAMPDDGLLARGRQDQRIEVVPSLDLVVIRQGESTSTPESGEESFDNQLWLRLMKAIGDNITH